MPGEFEYRLLTSAARPGNDAYGSAIREEMEEAAGNSCSSGARHRTLDRLEVKGLAKTRGEIVP